MVALKPGHPDYDWKSFPGVQVPHRILPNQGFRDEFYGLARPDLASRLRHTVKDRRNDTVGSQFPPENSPIYFQSALGHKERILIYTSSKG